MKRTIAFCAAGLIIAACVVQIYADIARPKPSPSPAAEPRIVLHTGLTIVSDANSYDARLQIPESELKELREALGTTASNESMLQKLSHSSTRTIVAGMFLFLSVSFAGVWLARSGTRRSYKAAAAVLLTAAVLGAATVITRANAGPPGYVRWQGLPKALTEGRATRGGVNIEIVPEGYGMKLIVPLKKARRSNGTDDE